MHACVIRRYIHTHAHVRVNIDLPDHGSVRFTYTGYTSITSKKREKDKLCTSIASVGKTNKSYY